MTKLDEQIRIIKILDERNTLIEEQNKRLDRVLKGLTKINSINNKEGDIDEKLKP